MDKKVLISHSDSQYAQQLAQVLPQHWLGASVIVADSLSESELSSIDCVITDDVRLAEELKEKGMYLCDDCAEVQNGSSVIFRFQPINLIVSQLMRFCSAALENNAKYLSFREAGDTNFIGITSGAGGTGVSSLAVCMGRILARLYEKSVLYVSFEAYKPLQYAFSFPEAAYSLDELLYRIVAHENSGRSILKNCLSKDSFDLQTIGHRGNISPLVNAEEEDVYQFLYFLASCGMFDVIVLDVPSSFAHYTSVMRMCERQVINFGCNVHRYIPSLLLKGELEDLCSYELKAVQEHIFEFKPLWDDVSFILAESGFDVDIHGQFGAEVRELVNSMEVR